MALVKDLLSKAAIFVSALLSLACSSSPVVGPSLAVTTEISNTNRPPAALADCPSKPNCASSVTTDPEKRVASFDLNGQTVLAFQTQLEQAVELDGGVVKDKRDGYFWATYTSSVFRFVDDIEWLYNAERNQFDVRSASRIGYSDLGVNRKRVERLRSVAYTQLPDRQ